MRETKDQTIIRLKSKKADLNVDLCAQDRTRTAKQSRGCHISADHRSSNKYNLIRATYTSVRGLSSTLFHADNLH